MLLQSWQLQRWQRRQGPHTLAVASGCNRLREGRLLSCCRCPLLCQQQAGHACCRHAVLHGRQHRPKMAHHDAGPSRKDHPTNACPQKVVQNKSRALANLLLPVLEAGYRCHVAIGALLILVISCARVLSFQGGTLSFDTEATLGRKEVGSLVGAHEQQSIALSIIGLQTRRRKALLLSREICASFCHLSPGTTDLDSKQKTTSAVCDICRHLYRTTSAFPQKSTLIYRKTLHKACSKTCCDRCRLLRLHQTDIGKDGRSSGLLSPSASSSPVATPRASRSSGGMMAATDECSFDWVLISRPFPTAVARPFA